jgi:hypothetical protein
VKATLEFDRREEEQELQAALNGQGLLFAISEFDGWLRDLAKYEGKNQVAVDEVRSKLREYVNDNVPDIWDGL